ncbi:MAG TPA: hypothetical protein VE270_03020 [Thermoleophilaceae bacterium]|nr:hypothetical protein [Thermoleophilaceae bacterium]
MARGIESAVGLRYPRRMPRRFTVGVHGTNRAGGDVREQTGIRIAVRVVEPGALPRSEGKAVRVVDRRPG